MGIKQLMRLIQDKASGAVRETELKNLFGRKVAMDASMALYSFMVAIRPDANFTLADESGEATSHLNGAHARGREPALTPCCRHLLPHHPHDETRAQAHLGV